MSSANKRKGTRWESAVRDWFLARRQKAHRPAQTGALDVGDVHVDGMFVIQAKDAGQARYSEWVQSAKDQAANAGMPFGVVVHKRRQRGTADAYVVTDLDTFGSIMRRLAIAEDFLWSSPHANAAYKQSLADLDTPPDGASVD